MNAQCSFSVVGVVTAALFAAPLSAQSANPLLDPNAGDTQVSAAITIPLGASPDNRRTAPRFEIISKTRAPDSVLPVVARDEERRWQERRIGFTLDGSDELMLNGQPLPDREQRDGVSTLGAIAIGVGVVLIISAFTLADAINDLED